MTKTLRAIVMAAFVGVALAFLWAGISGFTDYSPGVQTIQGESVCSGAPTAGDPLSFNGSTWCGGIPYADGLNFLEQSGTHVETLFLDSNNNLYLQSPSSTVKVVGNQTLQLSNDGLQWDETSDLTEVNAPRTPLTIYSPLSTTGVVNMPAHYVPSVAMTVRSWTLTIEPATGACQTQPTFAVDVNGTLEAASLVTTTSAANTYTVSGLAISVPASNYVTFAVDTAGSGCPWTSPSAEAIIELTTD